jgi:hypothetical protein
MINKGADVIAHVFGYAVSMLAQGLNQVIYRVLPVKALPHPYAGRAQAASLTGVGIEDDGPVVKLLPEHDERVGYGFFTGHARIYATCMPQKLCFFSYGSIAQVVLVFEMPYSSRAREIRNAQPGTRNRSVTLHRPPPTGY